MPSCRFAPPAPRDSAANLMLKSSYGLRRGNRILPLAMPWHELVLLSGIIGNSSPQLVSNRFSGTGAPCPKDPARTEERRVGIAGVRSGDLSCIGSNKKK